MQIKNIRIAALLTILACILFKPITSQANVPEHAIRMFHQEPFVEEKKKFFPFDTIYTVVDFADMQPGEYTVNIEWIQPNGKLVRNSSHPFLIEEEADFYRVFFWLKLHAAGPLSQLIGASEYTSDVYGQWKVRISCNGNPLSSAVFDVTDSLF
jgi:hypothetical protein